MNNLLLSLADGLDSYGEAMYALTSELETQGRITDDLLLSYREQFNIGRRSLLVRSALWRVAAMR